MMPVVAPTQRQIHRIALGLLITVASAVPEFAPRAGEAEQSWDCPVIFSRKLFMDTGDFVYVAGTAVGEGVAYKYNTIAISCSKKPYECLFNSMDSIGRIGGACQVSRLDIPQPYKIEQWTDTKIVATLNTRCGGGETFVIDRRSKTPEITTYAGACPSVFQATMKSDKQDLEKMLKERPDLAQDPDFAKELARVDKALTESTSEKKVYHSTIEDPPFWKEFKRKIEKSKN